MRPARLRPRSIADSTAMHDVARLRSWLLLVPLIWVAACGDTTPLGPSGERITVCHRANSNASASLIQIFASERATYQAQGAYVATLSVDKNSVVGDSIHFRTITEALAAARAGRILRNETASARCRITIEVAAGTYAGTAGTTSDPLLERFPMIIDVPDISIVGALKMGLDAAGRATGVSTTGATSTIVATPALIIAGSSSQTAVSEEMFIVNTTTSGQRGDGAVIEGFVLNSGHQTADTTLGGQGVLTMRAENVIVRGNKFEGNFTERVDARVGSGTIEKNHSIGRGSTCDMCVSGPGTFVVRDNTIIDGGIPGVLSTPVTLLPVPASIEQFTLPATSQIVVTVVNNEVRGHQRVPVGVGIRIAGMGVGAPAVAGTTKATVNGNRLVNNRFGLILEAGFPVAGGALRGDIEFTGSGNTFEGSCQNNVLVSLARHTTGLGLNTNPYLRNSTYALTFGTDIPFASVWYAHPANLGNTLTVNGAPIGNGTVHAYNASKVCP
ncbi:MAG: right-handed parallel beta-helix repeat-containing protein [Gemmatimonadaceae bacterium]|nr:right-handed parallel beta-helix repeat-containing protein [Gemmatimonadaceae bacterium]